jgi:hypothetical protein
MRPGAVEFVNVTEIRGFLFSRVYYFPMVVQPRAELGRIRFLYFLTIALAAAAVAASATLYPRAGQNLRAALVVLGGLGFVALVLALLLLYSYPKRSQVLLVQRGTEMILATNAIHEGFKLRFLRDILADSVSTLSDEDRSRWKVLEADGFYPAICIRNPRKVLILRLCTMVFDDVFAVDVSNRWEHHDSSSTSEPTFARGEKPQLKAWKELDAGSGSG